MPTKLTNNIIDDRLKDRNVKRIGNYINSHYHIKFLCLNCDNIWESVPLGILKGSGCPLCGRQQQIKKAKHNNEQVDNKIIGKNIKRCEEYINAHHKINFQCTVCNMIWKAEPNLIIRGENRCRICFPPQGGIFTKYTNENIDEKLKNTNILKIENYINIDTKIKFECVLCHTIWKTKPYSILVKNSGCPKCSLRKSEKRCLELIQQHCKNYKIEQHKVFYFNNRRYVPDFYLETDKNKIIIEYNGHQHYFPVRFNSISKEKSEINFYKQICRDEELRQYCKENNIKLIEIPYWMKETEIIEELQLI